jgi:hypothetical protein
MGATAFVAAGAFAAEAGGVFADANDAAQTHRRIGANCFIAIDFEAFGKLAMKNPPGFRAGGFCV